MNLERTSLRHFFTKNHIFLLLLAATFTLFSAQLSAQSDEEPDLVIAGTHGIGFLFYPIPEENTEDDLAQLAAEINAIEEEFVDPVLVQLGDLFTPFMILESAYNSPVTNFIRDNDYDILHYSTKDYIVGNSHGYGIRRRSSSDDDYTMTGIDFEHYQWPKFPTYQTVVKNEKKATFASLTSKDLVKGIPSIFEQSIIQSGENISGFFDAEIDSAKILFTELPDELLMGELGKVNGTDLIIKLGSNESLGPIGGDLSFFEAPQSHEIIVLKGYEKENGTWTWEKELRPWTTRERMASLAKPKLPLIGVSVPDNNRVAELLDIDPFDVTLEVFRDHDNYDLTSRDNIYVYQIKSEENNYRVYRVLHDIQTFWIYFDVLLVVNPDHTIRQVYVHDKTFPFHSKPTTLFSSLQTLLGKKVSDFPDELPNVQGIENQVAPILEDIKNTLIMDERLYGSI